MKDTNYLNCLFIAPLLFAAFGAQAQTLRGTLRTADEGLPVKGATVNIFTDNIRKEPISMASDSSGEFIFEKLPIGYYWCEVHCAGYEPQVLSEILVIGGRVQVLEIDLRRIKARFPAYSTASTQSGRRPMQLLGETVLHRDQCTRFPAMYFDLSRLAAAQPGVLLLDDGTNMMSIRGNSPAMLRWRLEGLDIVNPNHLPNAGTLSDAPTVASGGALVFALQMLDNSSLLMGAYPEGYGDAVAGVMALNLRNGNNQRDEISAQASLVGLGLALEGPLKKKSGSAYLFSLRSSTTGLLSRLGITFGDEEINFQDLSFKLNLNSKRGGIYSVFGTLGLSENIYKQRKISNGISYDKEQYNIDFHSWTGIVGGSGKWKTGARDWFKAAIAYSSQSNDWKKPHYDDDRLLNQDIRSETRFSNTLEWQFSHTQNQFSAGSQMSWIAFHGNIVRISYRTFPPGLQSAPIYDMKIAHFNTQLWLRWNWASRNGRLSTQLGSQFHYNIVYQKFEPAPRALIACHLSKKHRVALSAGLYKQDAPIWLQRAVYINDLYSFRLPYISSLQTGLKYTWVPADVWTISAEFFSQTTENLPADTVQFFSLYNQPEHITDAPIFGSSKARNYGIEVSLSGKLQLGWFLVANATLLESYYQLPNQRRLDTHWDIGHTSNLTVGKEWRQQKMTGLNRTLGISLRGVWSGGVREPDINFGASIVEGRTIFYTQEGYYRRYPDYFRADVRLYWRRNHGDRSNSTFAIELQNFTGKQNLAFHYYDPFRKSVENKYQLGIIPNLSWNIEL